MEKIIRTAGILIFKNNKVLLIRHMHTNHPEGTYGIPAGQIKKIELNIETAIRKLREEAGLITSKQYLKKMPKQYAANIEQKNGRKRFSLDVYICNKYEGELKSTNIEIPEWVSIPKLKKLKLLPNMEKIIKDALKLD